MGFARALLQKDVQKEEEEIQKQAKKKSLWGSLGRTGGGLLAAAFTGGLVNPVTLAAITGAASYAGGAIGSRSAGKIKGGNFFRADRESLQKELGAFGTQNLTSSLKAGVTAGIGQKLSLMKSGDKAAKLSEGLGMDFGGSVVGKGLQKAKTASLAKEFTKKGWIDPDLQNQLTGATGQKISTIHEGGAPIVAMDRRKYMSGLAEESGKKASLDDFLMRKADFASEFVEGMDPLGPQRMRVATDVPEFSTQLPIDPTFEYGAGGGRMTGPTWSRPAYSQGTFYEKKWRGGHPIGGR